MVKLFTHIMTNADVNVTA